MALSSCLSAHRPPGRFIDDRTDGHGSAAAHADAGFSRRVTHTFSPPALPRRAAISKTNAITVSSVKCSQVAPAAATSAPTNGLRVRAGRSRHDRPTVSPIAWLDEIFAGSPAYFVDSFAHSAWVSSRALQIAGIDRKTPDPDQGIIERDAQSGEPVGVLRDAAMDLVARHLPQPSRAELAAAVETGLVEVRRLGITAYTEPGLAEPHLIAYHEADQAREIHRSRTGIALAHRMGCREIRR